MDDYLNRLGLGSHVDDAELALAYEETPSSEKGIIKNAVALTHAGHRNWVMTSQCTRQWGSVGATETAQPAAFALFLYHPQRFPLPALASAITLALMARVPYVAVVTPPPLDRALLFACDFLSVSWIYHAGAVDLSALAEALTSKAGLGRVVDLGLGGLPTPLCFAADDYPMLDTLSDSPIAAAYARILGPLRHTDPSSRVSWYLACGEKMSVSARFILPPRLVGGWPWDRLGPEDFLVRTTVFF